MPVYLKRAKKIWVCTNCGDCYQLEPWTDPPRDKLGDVLCAACNDYQARGPA